MSDRTTTGSLEAFYLAEAQTARPYGQLGVTAASFTHWSQNSCDPTGSLQVTSTGASGIPGAGAPDDREHVTPGHSEMLADHAAFDSPSASCDLMDDSVRSLRRRSGDRLTDCWDWHRCKRAGGAARALRKSETELRQSSRPGAADHRCVGPRRERPMQPRGLRLYGCHPRGMAQRTLRRKCIRRLRARQGVVDRQASTPIAGWYEHDDATSEPSPPGRYPVVRFGSPPGKLIVSHRRL